MKKEFEKLIILLFFVVGLSISSASAQTWTKVDDAAGGWTYTGTYESWSEPVAYMGTVTGLGSNGKASYTFTGTQVRFYATLHNFPGSAGDIYVDDIFKQTVNLHNEGGLVGDVMVYESEALSAGSHDFRIERTGGEVLVDAIEYLEGAGDTDPPTPNPAQFASPPAAVSDSAISMTAVTGSDASPPVEYYFAETSGNAGGSDSGWQTSTSYTDTGLSPATEYTYTVQMRDSVPNIGTASSPASATTLPADVDPPTPDPMTWASPPSSATSNTIEMTATTASDPSGVEYYFANVTDPAHDSGWQDSASYTDTGLTPSTQYCYEVQARDKSANQNATAWSTNECATTLAEAPNTFYVAPGGNDSGAGTIGDPWATLAGARDNIRPLLDGTDDISVYFRGGTYTFTDTVVFGTSDSGTANQVITYKAYPGETPVFSSLKQVTGWSTYSGNIMQANLPGGISHVRYLQDASENWMGRSETDYFQPAQNCNFCNEEPMYESSYGGLSNVQQYKTFVQYPSSGWSQPNWSYADQYDLRFGTTAWTVNVLPVSSVETGNRRINVATPATYVMLNPSGDCSENQGWVLNTIEGIDSAGEWACLNGKIYLYPKSGTGDIYVPGVTELVRVDEGTTDGNQDISTPVQYINFGGITFTGSDFYIRQYDYATPTNSDVTSQHDWGIVDVPAGMLRFRNAANCTVDGCTFTKSGGGGVRLDRYAQNITVINCEFSYLGREAVSLMGRGIGYGDVNKGNEISYNNMIATGREKWDAPAINLSQSSGNWIHHNFIDDTHVSAIIFTSSRGVYLAYKCYEDSDSYFIGAECHYWECHPTAVDTSCDEATYGYEEAKIESHKYMYNYDNVIEKNVVTDAHNGGQFFFVDNIFPTNGIVYTSGGTFNKTNYLELNYFYDCDPQPNTQLLYADSYMDHMHANKNMMHNVQIGNGAGEAYVLFDVFCNWQDWNVQHGNQQGYVNANVEQNSSYGSYTYGMFINTDGNIDLDDNNPNGSASFVNDYEEMWSLLCPGVLPGPSPLPGSSELQSSLASKINQFGGTVPTCGEDTDPPTPNPATFASPPSADSDTAISMTADTGSDASPPVEYYFDETSGNPGGSDSIWQTSPSYTDTGLTPSTEYTYTVTMRDSLGNTGSASTPASATTLSAPDTTPPTPDPMTWATFPYATGSSSIAMGASPATDPSGVEYYFTCSAGGGNDSGWQDGTFYEDTGLQPETEYLYNVKARDKSPNQNETGASSDQSATTDPAVAVDDYANNDIPVAGTVTGSYVDTQASDDVYEAITEIESGGKPANRRSYMEHKWTINVTGGNTVTFYVEAYHTANSEGDDFIFAYSTDDLLYTNMLLVTKTADDDTVQSYSFPGSTAGTVYIQVMDADTTKGNRVLDTVYIDEMYITSDPGGGPCTPTDCHVQAIACGTAAGSQGKKYGQVTVTIHDDCGNPVANADVTGTFTGDYSETLTEMTNGAGQAVLTTTTQVKKPTYQFCVDDVVGSLPYDDTDNVETCDTN